VPVAAPEFSRQLANLELDLNLPKPRSLVQNVNQTFYPSEEINFVRVDAPASLSLKDLGKQGHLSFLNIKEAWSVASGEGVTVAVIDTGVNEHPSLEAKLLAGYDFITDSTTQIDESGHGTAIATLIAGSETYIGVAPNSKILPLKVLNKYKEGSSADVVEAILFAADLHPVLKNEHKADIVNLSLGLSGYNKAIHEAIKEAKQAGLVVIASAGNASTKLDFPAYLTEVISVAAAEVVNGEWQLAPYSNFGEGLDVLAPVGGWSPSHSGMYAESGLLSYGLEPARFNGSSFATPLVTGLAALLYEKMPDAQTVEAILKGSATDLNANAWDETSGYGALNITAALKALELSLTQVKTESSLVLQVLDAGSQQERFRYLVNPQEELFIPTGSYNIRIWQDDNSDGLWTSSEAVFRTETNVRLYNDAVYLIAETLEFADSY